MPHHLLRVRCNPETWARLADNPEDRMQASKAGANDYGGEMLGYWYSTGQYDIYSLLRAPDVETGSSLHAALFASGAFSEFNQTMLLTVDEMREAMRNAREWPTLRNYRPPGAKATASGE